MSPRTLFSIMAVTVSLVSSTAVPGETLRDLADKRGIGIGAAVAVNALREDEAYRAVLAREYNLVVPENAMKMQGLHPAQDQFAFADADAIVTFASRNKMQVRGHTLVWHESLPAWVTTASWSRTEALAVLSRHITTVVSHFKGKVYAWDVVNEAFEDDGSMRKTVWLDRIGPDYIEQAFRMAHAADPAALLFYNDYAVEFPNKKADAMLALAKDFKARGVPIVGVGFQCHFPYDHYPEPAQFAKNMNRFSSLGLQVHITELDLSIPTPVTAEKRTQQAHAYRDIVTAALKTKNCTAVLTWGFTDKYSWIPHFRKGQDEALPFDRLFAPKPAYAAIRDALIK